MSSEFDKEVKKMLTDQLQQTKPLLSKEEAWNQIQTKRKKKKLKVKTKYLTIPFGGVCCLLVLRTVTAEGLSHSMAGRGRDGSRVAGRSSAIAAAPHRPRSARPHLPCRGLT